MHTPGPWIVVEDYDGGRGLHVRAHVNDQFPRGGTTVVVLPNRRNGARRGMSVTWDAPTEESIANSRLIAAAPQLLESLKQAIRYSPYQGESQETDFLRMARAAIAKAEGSAA